MNKIIIRPSLPKDVEQAAPLIYSSGPKAFDFVFKSNKNSVIDFLSYAFVRPCGEFSYQNHQSVLANGKVVGIGAVFTGGEMLKFTLADAKKIISFYKLNCFSHIISGLRIESLIKPPKKNEAVVSHLGIDESMRGQGIGTQLINHLMKTPKIKGETHFVLDVSKENPQAKKLYERLGFRVAKTCVSNLKNKHSVVPNHFRMEREVG